MQEPQNFTATIRQKSAAIWRHFMHDSLYRNSIFLMSSMAVSAFLGFVFLAIAARFYSVDSVGRATAIISLINLLANLSILGLNNAVIRFFKSIKKIDSYINAVLLIVSVSALAVASLFLLNAFWLDKQLSFLAHSFPLFALFNVLVILTTINIFTDSVFVARRIAIYVLVENIFLGFVKAGFPAFLSHLHYLGVVYASGLSVVAALIVTAFGFKRFGYHFSDKPDFTLLRGTRGYAFGNYISGIASSGAPMLVPVIALSILGAKKSAYFYTALMIANLLFVIPSSINRSLFAEGSHDESSLAKHVLKSARFIAMLLGITIAAILLFGKPFLHIFGASYATNSYVPLLILAFSGVFVAVTNTVGTILNVRHKIRRMMIMNVLGFFAVVAGCIVGAHYGLVALSVGWLIGQAFGAAVALGFLHSHMRAERLES